MKKRLFSIVLALMLLVNLMPENLIPAFVKESGAVSTAQAAGMDTLSSISFPDLGHFERASKGAMAYDNAWPHEKTGSDNSYNEMIPALVLTEESGRNPIYCNVPLDLVNQYQHNPDKTSIEVPLRGFYRPGDITKKGYTVSYGLTGTVFAVDSVDVWWPNEPTYVGIAASGTAHWVEPSKISSVRADIGAPTRNGYNVQKGDTVIFYQSGTNTELYRGVAGDNGVTYNFESPRYYFDLNGAYYFVSTQANNNDLEMVENNNCASFVSMANCAAGCVMYAAWASDPNPGSGHTNWDNTVIQRVAQCFGSDYVVTGQHGHMTIQGTLSDHCFATISSDYGIKSGDSIQVAGDPNTAEGGHMMYVAKAYTEGDTTYMEIYANSTSAKALTNAYVTAIAKTSKLAIDIEVERNGSLKITKKDDAGTLMSGVTFTVTGPDNYSASKSTGSDGTVTFENLPAGDYTVTESVPTGYRVASTSQTVTVSAGSESTATFTNIRQGRIKVTKVETNHPNNKIQGATFQIINSSGTVVDTLVTESDGTKTSKWLDLGTYTVKETSSGKEYYPVLAANQTTSITAANQTKELTFKNLEHGRIKITKEETNHPNNKIQGAKFQILNSSGTVVATLTTGSDGTATSGWLPVGSYTVKETDSGKEYYPVLAANQTTSITDANQTKPLTFKNLEHGRIRITKVEEHHEGNKIQGAKFDIKNSSGTVVDTLTTGADGTAISKYLPVGDYTVTETATSKEYYVIVTKDTATSLETANQIRNLTIRNRERGKIKIVKKDSLTSAPVRGAKFEIRNSSGTAVADSDGKTVFETDANGEVTTGWYEYGTYTVTEIYVPEGYRIIASEQKKNQDVFEANVTVTTTVNNMPQGHIEITKYDEKYPNTKIEGAKFEIHKDLPTGPIPMLRDANGNVTEIPHPVLVTDANGKATSDWLDVGTYYLVETYVPEGWRIGNADSLVTNVEANVTKTLDIVATSASNMPQAKIKVIKYDEEDSSKKIPYTEFDVVRNDSGEVVDHLVTDANGEAITKYLDWGEYTLVETKAHNGYWLDPDNIETPVDLRVTAKTIVPVEISNKPVKIGLTIYKRDTERYTGEVPTTTAGQMPVEKTIDEPDTTGDAIFKDAEFQVKAYEDIYDPLGNLIHPAKKVIVPSVKTTSEGASVHAEDMWPGIYEIIELNPPTGYLPSNTSIILYADAPGNQTEEHIVEYQALKINDVIKGKFQLKKLISRNEVETGAGVIEPEWHAEFDVYLKSAGSYANARSFEKCHVITDEDGVAITPDLPYGRYVIEQTSGTPGYYWLGPDEFDIEQHGITVKKNYADYKKKFNVRFVKIDAETGERIPIPDVSFKLQDEDGNYITMNDVDPITLMPIEVSVYKTNISGRYLFPEMFDVGTYYMTEISAPEGYILPADRIPLIVSDHESSSDISLDIENTPVFGQIKVEKHGLQLVGFEDSSLNGVDYNKPVFEDRPLAGVTFEVYAREDIVGKEGTVWHDAGDLVETITMERDGTTFTNKVDVYDKDGTLTEHTESESASGEYISSLLHLGEYTVIEKEAPVGYQFSSEPRDVSLVYEDQYTPVVYEKLNIQNDLASTRASLAKKAVGIVTVENEDGTVVGELTQTEGEGFTFALESTADIVTYNGDTLPSGSYVAVAISDEDGAVLFDGYLPFGKYLLKEAKTYGNFSLNEGPSDPEFPYDWTIDLASANKLTDENVFADKIEEPVINDLKYGNLVIKKYDPVEGHPVQGALLEVTDSEGEVVWRDYTDKNGELKDIRLIPGTYTVTEIKAPDGYLLNEVPVTVVIEDVKEHREYTVNMTNVPIRGKVWIEKTGDRLVRFEEVEDESGFTYNQPVFEERYLEGAEFEIYATEEILDHNPDETKRAVLYEKDELVDTIVTTAEGHDESIILPLGEYYVIESTVPEGYIGESEVMTVELTAGNQDVEIVYDGVEVGNTYIPAELSLEKKKQVLTVNELENGMIHQVVDEKAGEGFVFGLYNKATLECMEGTNLEKNNLVGVATSDKDGHVVFSGKYPHGEYYVKELATQEHYIMDEQTHAFNVLTSNMEENGNVIRVELEKEVLNELKYKNITLTKSDLTEEETIPGALIEVYDEDGNIIYREYTDKNGEIPDIPVLPGKYTFKEVIAPEGYELNVAIMEFTVDEDGNVTGDTIIHDDYTRVKFEKYDTETKKPLAGAEFRLYNEKHEAVMNAVSDENGLVVFEKIPWGTFTVEETTTPSGYIEPDKPVYTGLVIDGKYINNPDPLAKIGNEPNVVRVKKTDNKNNPLPGTKFGLFDAAGKEVMSTVADKDGIVTFTRLPKGVYTIKETEAVEGYLKCLTEYKVTISAAYRNSEEPLYTFVNQPKKIKYIKVDTSGNYLEGVEFALIDKATGKTVETVKSNEKGEFILTKFDYGDWIIREVKAPEGFNKMDDITLHVDENWVEPAPFTCVNIPNYYEFVKTDNNGNPLAGVEFVLEDGKGTQIRNLISGEDGIVYVTDLTPGTYTIREIKTLEGYTLTNETIQVEIGEKYKVPEEMYHLVNYPVVQTGVEIDNPWMYVGIGLAGAAILSIAVLLIQKKRKKISADNK